MNKSFSKSKTKVMIILIFLLTLLIVISCFIYYISDIYKTNEGLSYLNNSDTITVTHISDGFLLEGYMFDGYGQDDALIFYPGAKIEYLAYAPLMRSLAENGVDTFLLKMPLNLAIFGKNTANSIISTYNYKKWHLAGHSLGGAMIADYAYNSQYIFQDIFLLGSYSTKNLNQKNINTYFIYGSNDNVVNKEKLKENQELLNGNYKETILNGGNHAKFGFYGPQKGDGTAEISTDEQIRITVDTIISALGISNKEIKQ